MKLDIVHASAVELRKCHRYTMSVPVTFSWVSRIGQLYSAQGMTRDITSQGVYVYSDVLPPSGVLLQMEIHLPKISSPEPGMHLTGEGIVLRVEQDPNSKQHAGGGGFASSIQFYPESSEVHFPNVSVNERVGN